MRPVWILDDEPGMRWVLERALGKAGWPVRSFAQSAALLEALSRVGSPASADEAPAVLVSDVRMPGLDGLGVLATVHERLPRLPVIMMTAYTDLQTTVTAFEQGAFDYLAKPFDIGTAVDLIIRAARTGSRASVDAKAGEPLPSPNMVLSHSPAMQPVFRAIARLAASDATVLITGESGTGKELIAHALHRHSRRAGKPFVAVNAAAIPRDLLEAELFGHERGAFTGAIQARRGRFEEASGGTLFLDEIGDMPAELQTRLLRVLADGSFYRVGGTHPVQADARIVAATHQPLEERVRDGRFRADLFHRLNVIRLRLPALRERVEDIAPLAHHFLKASAARLKVPPRELTADALDLLRRFDYPGNVRQLENICQWLTVMTPGVQVEAHDLPPEVQAGPMGAAPAASAAVQALEHAPADARTGVADWRAALAQDARARLQRAQPHLMRTLTDEFERVLIRLALDLSGQRRGEAAQRLGVGRNTLTRKCQALGFDDGPADDGPLA